MWEGCCGYTAKGKFEGTKRPTEVAQTKVEEEHEDDEEEEGRASVKKLSIEKKKKEFKV